MSYCIGSELVKAELQRSKDEKNTTVSGAVDIPANIRLVGCLYAVNANATSRKEAKCKSHLAKNDTAWYNQIQGFSTIN